MKQRKSWRLALIVLTAIGLLATSLSGADAQQADDQTEQPVLETTTIQPTEEPTVPVEVPTVPAEVPTTPPEAPAAPAAAALVEDQAPGGDPRRIDGPETFEYDSDDSVFGGGGEPPVVPDPISASGDGDGDVSAAATSTRILSRTKKIPAAAFQNPTGNGVNFSNDGSCVYPKNGSDELYAPVMGLPAGATIIEVFAEGIDNDTVPWSLTFESGDGDGASPLHASMSSTGSGFVNVSDTTISTPVVTDIGGGGTSYWLEWDPNNTEAGGVDDGQHQICHVWIRYNITETYLTDVFSFVPVTPCAEFDTRPGLPGYTASFARMTAGDTYAIKMEGINAQVTCGTTADADGFVVSVFLLTPSNVAWLNVYSSALPNNNEAVIVGGPNETFESVSLLVEDAFIGGSDIKLTAGGVPGATFDVKIVITGYYELSDQPANRYAD